MLIMFFFFLIYFFRKLAEHASFAESVGGTAAIFLSKRFEHIQQCKKRCTDLSTRS